MRLWTVIVNGFTTIIKAKLSIESSKKLSLLYFFSKLYLKIDIIDRLLPKT